MAITGPSGCGKSTLLHLLAAIDSPTTGSVTVAGQDLAHLGDPSGYRRKEVGLVFQFHNLLPQLSAVDNVELPMFGTHHRPVNERPERATCWPKSTSAVASTGCRPSSPAASGRESPSPGRWPTTQRSCSPTSQLAASTRRRHAVLGTTGSARRGGVTIVMVTHAPDVAAHADRIIEMRDGTIVGQR